MDEIQLDALKDIRKSDHLPWVLLKYPEGERGWKIHVSVHPNDVNKLLPHVLSILEKYNGVGAKVASEKWAREMMNHQTQRGKTFTIYVPENISHVAGHTVDEIEDAIERNLVKTYHPAPNDKPVGRTGAVGTCYAHFDGEPLKVPEEYRRVLGRETVLDEERRKYPYFAVVPWKAEEFRQVFGHYPRNKILEALVKEEIVRTIAPHPVGRHVVNGVLEPGDVAAIRMDERAAVTGEGRGITVFERGRMEHGEWSSPLKGHAYVLSSDRYVKVDDKGVRERPITKMREFTQHLHKEPHLLVIPDHRRGIVRIQNVGHRAVRIVK